MTDHDDLYECVVCKKFVDEWHIALEMLDNNSKCACEDCKDQFEECPECGDFYQSKVMELLEGRRLCNSCFSEAKHPTPASPTDQEND